MAVDVLVHEGDEGWAPPPAERLAQHMFGLLLAGVFAVILLMIIMGGWWAA